MMIYAKKYLVGLGVLALVFVLINTTRAERSPERTGGYRRVVAHTEEETNNALAHGCAVVREARTVKALHCPEEAVALLSLQDDIRVFALDNKKDEESYATAGRTRVGIASSGANQQIGATVVHTSGNTGAGRKIVVLDTGYNYTHPELISSYLGGKDFVNNDADPADDNGHGSHVAGIITADGINPSAKGVAPSAGVIAGKVLDLNGSGYFSDVVAGIYWAIDGPDGVYGTTDDFGADAVSLSLGTAAPYTYRGSCDGVLPDLTNAIKYAVQHDVGVVVAAGNSGNAGVAIPGCISYATTVGAVDSRDKIASFSGRGNALDIVAPGISIYSSVLGSGYASWNGTSMATPMVSGVIALMKSAKSSLTAVQVQSKLFSTAKDLGRFGKDTTYGWGRVNAAKAVQ